MWFFFLLNYSNSWSPYSTGLCRLDCHSCIVLRCCLEEEWEGQQAVALDPCIKIRMYQVKIVPKLLYTKSQSLSLFLQEKWLVKTNRRLKMFKILYSLSRAITDYSFGQQKKQLLAVNQHINKFIKKTYIIIYLFSRVSSCIEHSKRIIYNFRLEIQY